MNHFQPPEYQSVRPRQMKYLQYYVCYEKGGLPFNTGRLGVLLYEYMQWTMVADMGTMGY